MRGVERYVIEAVVRDGQSHRQVARSAGVSKAWVTKLIARYREGRGRTWKGRRDRASPSIGLGAYPPLFSVAEPFPSWCHDCAGIERLRQVHSGVDSPPRFWCVGAGGELPAPNNAHNQTAKIGIGKICGHPQSTPGGVGQGEPFVSSALERPTPNPNGTEATRRAFVRMRLIRQMLARP
jgi:hypothetical protein